MKRSNIWPRISELAQDYGVAPMASDDFAVLAAKGADGQTYDVELVIAAIHRRNEDAKRSEKEWLFAIR